MTPKEIAKALGGHDYEESERVLASLGPESGQDVAKAIRNGFEGGDEQGNGRRLVALVKIEGEGALDVICAALEDTVEVGGKYSNQRNGALELIRAHFLGNRTLEKSLWKALEIARRVADKLSSKDYQWQRAASLAIGTLPPSEIFDRVSPLLDAKDRAKPKALTKLDLVTQGLGSLDDPRWFDRLRTCLDAEESPKVRELIVPLLGLVGPKAIEVICAAPRDDKDTKVIASMLDTIMTLKGKDGVLEHVRSAAEAAGKKGKRAKALRDALAYLEE